MKIQQLDLIAFGPFTGKISGSVRRQRGTAHHLREKRIRQEFCLARAQAAPLRHSHALFR